jgi:hypothetical protein
MAKCRRCGKKMSYFDKCYPISCGFICLDCHNIIIQMRGQEKRKNEIII